jgi:hypothetical protein
MTPLNDPLCIHCEQRPSVTELGLCAVCDAAENIRVLYTRRRHWTPQWELHLRRLAARARQRLPLFPEEPSAA